MTEEISYEDFSKVDMRIGTVVKAEVPEWSHWVMKLTVNFGEEIGERIIFAGVMKFYEVKDLEGKQFPFVVNMKPKKIGPKGDFSQGMMLAATAVVASENSETPEERPILFKLTSKVVNGSKVR